MSLFLKLDTGHIFLVLLFNKRICIMCMYKVYLIDIRVNKPNIICPASFPSFNKHTNDAVGLSLIFVSYHDKNSWIVQNWIVVTIHPTSTQHTSISIVYPLIFIAGIKANISNYPNIFSVSFRIKSAIIIFLSSYIFIQLICFIIFYMPLNNVHYDKF